MGFLANVMQLIRGQTKTDSLWEASINVEFDAQGISTDYESSETPAVAWGNITAIFIVTTSAGPFTADFFWCFASRSEQKILSFPDEANGVEELAEELPTRFDGIDFAEFDVSNSTRDNVFLLWGELPEAD